MLFDLCLLENLAPSPQAANPLVGFLPILLIFGIFYVLLFLPMQRQKKAQQKMLRELQNGSLVLTSGGVIGSITEIKEDDTLVLRVKPDGIKLLIARSAVTSVLSGAGEAKK
ncbi:MAG: preprotein translocase subunit YajC [Bryobacteraceae bacterium]